MPCYFAVQLPEAFVAELDPTASVLLPTGLNVQVWTEVWDTSAKKTSRWFYDDDRKVENLFMTDGDDTNGLKNERRIGYFKLDALHFTDLNSSTASAGLVDKVRLHILDEPRKGAAPKAYEWVGSVADFLKAKGGNPTLLEKAVATRVLVLTEVSMDTVRQRYVEALWNVYTRLRSLSLTSVNRSRALAAEASLLLAALEMTRDMRQEMVSLTPWLNDLAEKIFPAASYASEEKKTPGSYKRRTSSFFNPCSPLLTSKKNPWDGYPKYATGVAAELNTRSRNLYESVFRGLGDKNEVEYQFVAVGDGITGTTGLLQRKDEGIGIFLYENAESGKSRNTRKLSFPANEALRVPTIHIVQFGLEGSDAAKLVFRCGSKSYTLTGKGTWSSPDTNARVEKVKTGTTTIDRTRWSDGATFDPRLNDFTFGSSVYATSDGAFTVEIHAAKFSGTDYDEMAVAVIRLPSYAPVGLLGLFGTDECVPRWPDEIPLTETITATEKTRGTPSLLADRKELVGVLKNSFDSLISIKDALKAGTLNSAAVSFVAKGPGNVVAGSLFGELEHIDDAAMKKLLADWKAKPATEMEEYFQQLRASIVELDGSRKNGALDVKLTVRSFTDPRASYAHNVTLSEKRCWGLTGLLCRWLLDDGEKDRAKAIWNAANGSSTTKDAYLKEARKRLSGSETGSKAYDKTVTPLTAFDPKWVA